MYLIEIPTADEWIADGIVRVAIFATSILVVWAVWQFRFETWKLLSWLRNGYYRSWVSEPSSGLHIIGCWCYLLVSVALGWLLPSAMLMLWDIRGLNELTPALEQLAWWYQFIYPLELGLLGYIVLAVTLDHLLPYTYWLQRFG
jgi:hypothetical protein